MHDTPATRSAHQEGSESIVKSIDWANDQLRLLNQLKLPTQEVWETYTTAAEIADAIVQMKVRGAPAIGAAAAYAIALEAQRYAGRDIQAFVDHLQTTMDLLHATRPTAVNLAWAITRMKQVLDGARETETDTRRIAQLLTDDAVAIADEDVVTNHKIGDHGAQLFHNQTNVTLLTHCNTGSLATVSYGTALGVIRALHQRGQCRSVYVDETRPYLQGARLTAYELYAEGIPHQLITDSMAGAFMRTGDIDAVIVGADRIVANGDTANKIGTYSLAVLAYYHKIPFYVAAPTSTFDLTVAHGQQIPIEQRNPNEVTHWHGTPMAPVGTTALHPAFDVTPAELITAIITEHGVIHAPNMERIRATLAG